jgi:hypothetical protein
MQAEVEEEQDSVIVTLKQKLSHMKLPVCSGVPFKMQWNQFLQNICCKNICCAAF